uniref:xyloglucan:xyloglucosyl transferase n=1 Tax=Leersia perrieri TaxID=77586 RepID=A0A0D9X5P8_9ORYZ
MGQARAHLLASLWAFYLTLAISMVAGDLTNDLDIMWGNSKVIYDSSGKQTIALTLDRWTTSAFRSKSTYLFGRIDMDIKLVAGNSAGTVTTLYMITEGLWQFHDEIDLEFLGNTTGEPYTLHTNLYARGKGGREKRYKLWFDPTADFHTYTIIWNQNNILILVDDKLIRQVKNNLMYSVPYPNYQPMRVYGSIWNADDWATQGGRVKTDWSQAPFTAYFRNYRAIACPPQQSSSLCGPSSGNWFNQELDQTRKQQLQEVDNNYKIYDYCTDTKRFKDGLPKESNDVPVHTPSKNLSISTQHTQFAHSLRHLALAKAMGPRAQVQLLAPMGALYLILAISPVISDMTNSLDMLWGNTQVAYDDTGHQIVSLSLDRWTTSAFRSKTKYLFGRIDMDIKLVAKDSAGTVTTLYMITEGLWDIHDEIDLEFLGNTTGEPYTLHTNIYARGTGGREKQYRLWFDPTEDFHTYTIIWNPQMILILVDGTPIRQMKNQLRKDIPFPLYQPMRLYASIWDADDWATQGGRIKTDWSQAPFTAFFRNYRANACVPVKTSWICSQESNDSSWFTQDLDEEGSQKLKDVDEKYKIYDYCTDSRRYPNGYPPECGSQ